MNKIEAGGGSFNKQIMRTKKDPYEYLLIITSKVWRNKITTRNKCRNTEGIGYGTL